MVYRVEPKTYHALSLQLEPMHCNSGGRGSSSAQVVTATIGRGVSL